MASNDQESEWELSKENVQPLKQGRKFSNLTAALQPQADQQVKLKEERQKFESELRMYDGDDPLSVWHRYILWLEQNYPKGSRSNLSQLIEQCVSQFKDTKKYKNDQRFLEIWIKFASFCNEPAEIFSFMFNNEICSELAAFYEAWASECEALGNMKRADSLYKQGLERCAYPVDWLEKRHRDFQARVAARLARGDPLTEENPPNPAEPERVKLGHLKGHGKSKKVGSLRPAMSRPAVVGTASAPSSAQNARGQAFTIFEENTPAAQHLPPQTGEWSTVPVRAEVNRENELKPGKWTDAKIRQRHAGVPGQPPTPITPTFQIHEDDEASRPSATPRKVVPEVNQVLSARKPPKPQDPLQHLMVNSGEDVKQVSMYCKHLVYKGTQEFSLEEIRAAHLEKIRAAEEEQERMQRLKVESERLEEELKQQRQELAAVLEQKLKVEQEVQDKQKTIPPPSVMLGAPARPVDTMESPGQPLQLAPPFVPSPVNPSVGWVDTSEQPAVDSPGEPQTDPIVQPGSLKPPASLGAPSLRSYVSDQGNVSGPLSSGLVRPGIRTPQDSTLHTSNYSGFTSSEPPSVEPTPVKSSYMNPYRPSSNGPTPMGGGICAPSPTINTKEALKAVMGMFNQTLNQVPWSDSSKPDSADCSIETKPVVAPSAAPFTVFVEEENIQPKKPSVSAACGLVKDENENRSAPGRPRLGSRRPGLGPVLQPREEPPPVVEPLQEPSPIVGVPTRDQSYRPGPEPAMFSADGGMEFMPMVYSQPLREEDDIIMDDDKTVARPRDSDDYFDGNNFMDDMTFAPGFSSTRNFTDMARLVSTPFNPLGEAPQMPDPPMSSIKGDAGRHVGAEAMGVTSDQTLGAMMTSQHEVSSANQSVPVVQNASSGNQTAPSGMDYTEGEDYSKRKANLSPITECSDEDTKLGASSMAASHYHHDPRAAFGDLSHASRNTTNTTASTISPDPQPPSPKFAMPMPPMQKDKEKKGAENQNHWASKAAAACGLNQTCHEIDVTNYHLEDDNLQDLLSQSVIVNPYSDPFDTDLIEEFLGRLDVPIERYANYHRVNGDLPAMKAKKAVWLGNNEYDVVERLGEGAFAQVYTVRRTDGPQDEVNVVKVQTPPCPWEYYIACEMHRRLRENKLLVTSSIMHIDEAYFFDDGSCFVNDLLPRGTLLDVMNLVRQTRSFLPEAVILYMCIEMLRILESMMAINMIHGDVKPDNFLFRGLPYLPEDVRTHLKGETQCLRLIDFGRSIDMRMFPPGCSFGVCVETSGFQCIEMKTQRPWTYQTDMFGVVGTIHVLIFGEYMNIMHDGKKWKPTSRFKRWFRSQTLMQRIFDELLNVESCSSLPDVGALRRALEETFLNEYSAVYNKKLKDVDPSLIRDH